MFQQPFPHIVLALTWHSPISAQQVAAMASILVCVAILSSDLSYASQPEKFSQTTPVLMLFLCSGSTSYQPHNFQGSQHIPFHTTIFLLFTTTVSVQPNFSPFPFHTVTTLWVWYMRAHQTCHLDKSMQAMLICAHVYVMGLFKNS